MNKDAAVARFASLLREALQKQPPRKETTIPKGVNKRRLDCKKRRGRVKYQRSMRFLENVI